VCAVNGNFVYSESRPAPSTIAEKPSGAQLTIFYGGTVYVYDDIPTDKVWALK